MRASQPKIFQLLSEEIFQTRELYAGFDVNIDRADLTQGTPHLVADHQNRLVLFSQISFEHCPSLVNLLLNIEQLDSLMNMSLEAIYSTTKTTILYKDFSSNIRLLYECGASKSRPKIRLYKIQTKVFVFTYLIDFLF